MAGYIGSKAVSVNTTSATISDDLAVGDDATITGDLAVDGVSNLDVTNIVGNLTVTGDTVTFASGNSNDPNIVIKNTTSDANAPIMDFITDKGAAGADNDALGLIRFTGDNDAQEQITFARVLAEVADASDGAEGGSLKLQLATHDGEIQTGLLLVDGNAEDEIDVTIGSGVGSNTVISGNASIGGQTSLLDISTDWSPITSTMFEVFDGTGGSDSPNLMLSVDRNTTTAAGTIGFANRNNSSASTATGQVIAGITGRIITSDSNAGDDSGGELKFYSKPEAGAVLERLHITSGGDVNVKTGNLVIGTTGKGIDFSAQTRSAVTGVDNHAELLDHYEEGTWTPTFAGVGGSAGDAALTVYGATYTRVGNLVTVFAYFRITNIGSYSGNISFGGLPFASSSTPLPARVVGTYAPLKKVELVDTLPYVPNILKNTIVIEMNRIAGSDQSTKAQAQVSAWDDNLNENCITLTYNTA